MMKKILSLVLSFVLTAPAFAQSPRISLIRDAEIEELLKDYTRPLFRAAKVGENAVDIFLIQDPSFNAFVASGRKIFVNTGALTASKTPNQIIGVLAHETGHIAGGHLARLHESMKNAQAMMIIGMLLGGAAVVGASQSGSRNAGDGLIGAMTAPGEMARRSLLSYQRGEEGAADRSAINYLNATGQSAKGMIETFQRFASDSLFSARGVDPYTVSHPMPTDRIASLRELAEKSPNYNVKDSPALQARHDLMRAKLIGFTGHSSTVARAYPMSDQSLPAKYARSIAAYRNGNSNEGLRLIDGLISSQPNNAYFYELKGQILLEGGQAVAALAPLRKSLSLKPNSNLIRSMLGHALVATGDDAKLNDAIKELLQATTRDLDNADAYKQLAIAYGRKGQTGLAELASAQASFASGDFRTARQIAIRAKGNLTAQSPQWVRAEEIVNYKPPQQGG